MTGVSLKPLIPLFLLLVSGCSDAYQANSDYMKEVSTRFKSGQSWAELKQLLTSLGDDDLQLYNPCNEEHEDDPTPCDSYQLIANIPLPETHLTAGSATGQIYFSFGPDQMLGEHFYEIYYENHH